MSNNQQLSQVKVQVPSSWCKGDNLVGLWLDYVIKWNGMELSVSNTMLTLLKLHHDRPSLEKYIRNC